MLTLLANCLLDVFGGIAAAALAATAGWQAFKLLKVPELGPWAILILVVAVPGALRSAFVQMTILFLGIAAIALIGEGRAWRRRQRRDRIIKDLEAGRRPAHRYGLHRYS